MRMSGVGWAASADAPHHCARYETAARTLLSHLLRARRRGGPARGRSGRARGARLRQDSLFIHDAVYEHQAAEALSIHAWYVAAELGDAYALGAGAAAAVLAQDALPHRRRNMGLYADLPQVRRPGAAPRCAAGRLR